MRRLAFLMGLIIAFAGGRAGIAEVPAAGAQKVGRLPHVEFDPARKQVRVECEVLGVDAALEFFCCVKGTNDYESMVRSEVKPSSLHFALLAIGLKSGHPLTFDEATKKVIPPEGPPLRITMEYQKEGKAVSEPAWKWLRSARDQKPAPPFTWIFTGSRVIPQTGKYAGDLTGYLVSLANVDLAVIDVPGLVSRSADLLQWQRNPDVAPKPGTKVCMVIEPAENAPPKAGAATSTRQAR